MLPGEELTSSANAGSDVAKPSRTKAIQACRDCVAAAMGLALGKRESKATEH